MPKYHIAPRHIRRPRADDDYWPDLPATMDVIVVEDHPVDTGLVDEFGVTIWRTSMRERVGF